MSVIEIQGLKKNFGDLQVLQGIDFSVDEGAILINGARACVKCQVIDVLHLPGIEQENILYLQMLDGKENGGEALHIADLH